MAFAHGDAIGCCQITEILQTLGFAHRLHHRDKPVDVFNFKTQAAFPLGVEQVFVGLGQFCSLDRARVVSLNPH